jgi:glycosyltransferase involved in cell wall biosynthesis
MKIVNIIQRYPPAIGGSETWCKEVCRYLAEKGHQVRVLTLDVNTEEQFWKLPLDSERAIAFGRLALDRGVLVRRYRRSLPIHTFHHLFYGLILDRIMRIYFYGPHSGEMYGRIWREIKRADLVFLHTAPYPHNFIAFFLAKIFRKKVVFVPHFHPTHPHYERASNYWLMRHCDAVITVSPFEKEYLARRGVANEKLFITGNAIHTENYKPSNLDGFKSRIAREFGLKLEDKFIIFIGRKTPEKGVGYLIEAVKNLIPEMPVKLLLMGPGMEWYHDLYVNLSPEEKKRIIDVGVVSHQDKVNFLHISDLLVLPSKYEAFGIVFLEAWVCGIPVIGTTEGAMPSVIGDEGWLCRFGNVKDLTSKIRAALGNTKNLIEMGSQGKAKVLRHYTWDVIGEKTEKAVKSVYGRKKIAICTNAYPPNFIGGAELIAHNHAKILKKKGHEILVFAGVPDNRAKRYSIKKDVFEGIPIQRVCLHSRDYSGDYVNFFHKEVDDLFCRLLEDFSPDIVHIHNICGLSLNIPEMARHRKIRTVLTLHDYWGICYKNTLMKGDGLICEAFGECEKCLPFISSERWTNLPARMRKDYFTLQLRDVGAVISPSAYLAEIYERVGLFRKKIRVVHNGVDVARFQKVQRKENSKVVRFSFIGHLGRHKGVQTIIDALQYVETKDRVKLNLVGEGELKSELEKIAKKAGVKKLVRFWGQVENRRIEKVYANTDVLILPSLWPENQPVTITEAMACSLPVIASRIGGIPELVEDGKTGYLFDAGNPQDLALKMSLFLADPSKISKYGDNGFKKIKQYTFENQVDNIIKLYSENQNPVSDHPHDQKLIVCLGRKIPPECVEGFNSFLSAGERDYKLVMCDWLDEYRIRKAKFLWILDKGIDFKSGMVGLRNKIPLLVPEEHKKLKEFCMVENCGLYYKSDPIEIEVFLEYLTSNESVRKIMGRNGYKAFYKGRFFP